MCRIIDVGSSKKTKPAVGAMLGESEKSDELAVSWDWGDVAAYGNRIGDDKEPSTKKNKSQSSKEPSTIEDEFTPTAKLTTQRVAKQRVQEIYDQCTSVISAIRACCGEILGTVEDKTSLVAGMTRQAPWQGWLKLGCVGTYFLIE